jgi:hypothetical protein
VDVGVSALVSNGDDPKDQAGDNEAEAVKKHVKAMLRRLATKPNPSSDQTKP